MHGRSDEDAQRARPARDAITSLRRTAIDLRARRSLGAAMELEAILRQREDELAALTGR